jgi:hypothetical protein
VVEGARLERVCAGNRTEGSNPSLSANAIMFSFFINVLALILANRSAWFANLCSGFILFTHSG